MDKIAEHIAKFNAPKGSEFFWVSDYETVPPEVYMNDMNLRFLTLKLPSGKFKSISGKEYDWKYTLKHEQKGEQMKSIELSEEDLSALKDYINKIAMYQYSEEYVNSALSVLQNAKPIPTEPRWSEEEIREAFKLTPYLDEVLCNLKTPKPRLRDRNEDEKIKWWGEQPKPSAISFYKKRESGAVESVSDIYSATHYTYNNTFPCLPIPQIEIESEK